MGNRPKYYTIFSLIIGVAFLPLIVFPLILELLGAPAYVWFPPTNSYYATTIAIYGCLILLFSSPFYFAAGFWLEWRKTKSGQSQTKSEEGKK